MSHFKYLGVLLGCIFLVSCGHINNDSKIIIKNEFQNKLVYERNDSISIDEYKNHCNANGGTFNQCGSVCGLDAVTCIEMCAYTCELENLDSNNNSDTKDSIINESFSYDQEGIKGGIAVDQQNKEIQIKGEATGRWYFEGQFNLEVLDESGNTIVDGVAVAQGEWTTENYVPFEATMTYQELDTDNIKIVFKNSNPSGLPENDFSKTLNINLK